MALLRIRDVNPQSRIPDPGLTRSRIRIRIKEFKYFLPKKLVLSTQKLDPECSSQIPDPGAKSTGSRIQIRNTEKRHFDISVRQVRSIKNLNIEHTNSEQWTGYRCGDLNHFIFPTIKRQTIFPFL
jgi:hypothetical protein